MNRKVERVCVFGYLVNFGFFMSLGVISPERMYASEKTNGLGLRSPKVVNKASFFLLKLYCS